CRQEREQREEEDDLQRRRDAADALDLQGQLLRGLRLGRRGAYEQEDHREADGRETPEAEPVRGDHAGPPPATASRQPASAWSNWRADSVATAGTGSSSATSETCVGVRPRSRRRLSTVTTTSERRSPSGTAVS